MFVKVEITVEDPSMRKRRVRDYYNEMSLDADISSCLDLSAGA
jgi:hypothetical protein